MKDKSFKIIENSLEDIKALDTKVLNLQKLNTFTDTLLITSGSSSTHMSAISDRVIDDLKKNILREIKKIHVTRYPFNNHFLN